MTTGIGAIATTTIWTAEMRQPAANSARSPNRSASGPIQRNTGISASAGIADASAMTSGPPPSSRMRSEMNA